MGVARRVLREGGWDNEVLRDPRLRAKKPLWVLERLSLLCLPSEGE